MQALNKRVKSFISIIGTNNVSDFILEVRTVILCIGNNSEIFISPSPPLDIIAKSLEDLEIAETFVADNIPGSIPARNLQRANVLKAVQDLYNYVTYIADKAADESTAISIINASGFGLVNTKKDSSADNNQEVVAEA